MARLLKSPLVIIITLGFLVRLGYLLHFFEYGWEPDSYSHILDVYNIGLNMPESLWGLISIWSKPLYTTFFFVVDLIAPMSVPRLFLFQLLNTMWSLGAIIFIYKAFEPLIIKNKTTAAVIILLVAAMSYVPFRASVSALTEPIGAFCSAWSIYLISRQRFIWSSLVLGVCVLARIDMGLPCVVHAIVVSLHLLKSARPQRIREICLVVVATFLPAFLWNAIGFYHTGALLFLFTKGYPTTAGMYGYGTLTHYLDLFWTLDPVFLVCFLLGIVIWFAKFRDNLMLSLCLYVSTSYFIVMSVLWYKGSFALAGLGRYYVVVLPYFFIIAFLSIKFIVEQVTFRKKYTHLIAPALILIAMLGTLKPLVRKPKWKFNQWTAPATLIEPYHKIKDHISEFKDAPIHSDRPEIPYYLNIRERSERRALKDARNLNIKGVFVYVPGWSDGLSKVSHDTFKNARKIASYPGNINIYIRE